MGTTLRTLLVLIPLLAIAACGRCEPTVLRVPGSVRILEEPWQAWLSMEDDGVRVRLTYDPEDGGPRERSLAEGENLPWPAALAGKRTPLLEMKRGDEFPRVATVLEVPLDRPWNRILRRLPGDGRSPVSRLFLAAPGDGGRLRTLPFLAPPHPVEVGVARLGRAIQPRDLSMGFAKESVLDIRVTRDGNRVRYRWGYSTYVFGGERFGAGDVTIDDAQLREPGRGPILPELARMLERRTDWGGLYVGCVAFLETTDEVLGIDVLRAVECARGDASVLFFPLPPPWWWNEHCEFRNSIRVPRTTRKLGTETWRTGWDHRSRRAIDRFSLDAAGRLAIGGWRVTPEQAAKHLRGYDPDAERRVKPDSIVVLRFDGRCLWAVARPLVRRVRAAAVELRLRFMAGEHAVDPETELRLPVTKQAADLDLALADVPTRLGDVRGRVVRLTAPDTATVNDVWQAALAIMDAGATGVDFE